MLRAKIDHIVATQQGEPDEMAPGVLEETRFWCVVKRTKTENEVVKSLASN